MKKVICILLALGVLLSVAGCGNTPIAEETAPPTVEATEEYQKTIPETTEPEAQTMPATEPQPEETIPPTEPEVEIPAQEITEGIHFLVNDFPSLQHLTDRDIYTNKTFRATDKVVISSDVPFASLYFIWDSQPGPYTVMWDGGSVQGGQYGFLHEYISLNTSVTTVTLEFAEETYKTLCELYLYTQGAAPADVQVWLPPCEKADILVFPTHSDDDTLFFGALMAYYAMEKQLAVQTAFMVHHAAQPYRAHERLNGLWEMGIRNYPILYNAPDAGIHDFQKAMGWYSASKIPDWQVEQIRRFQPLVVVGHDLNGEYGNGGHKVNAYYLVRAIEYAADPELYPESAEVYGVWDTPKLYIHLYPENEWYFDVNTPMENDPQGRTPFEVAEDAFAHHKSQHQWGFHVQQDDAYRIYDCRPFGLYRSLVGEDTTADVMENIDPAQWRTE